MKKIRELIHWCINKVFFNFEHPRYFKTLYILSERYTKFYQGDDNRDRRTNGGWRFIKSYIKNAEPKVIFDVGAQMGTYTLRINDIDPSINVYAFEPAKKTYDELIQNTKGRSAIIPINLALSSKVGKSTLYTNSNINAINSLIPMNGRIFNHDSSEDVECSTVDDFSRKNKVNYIDMLKIDTEGNDLEVIRGSEGMLKSGKIGIVQFEFGIMNTYSHTYINDFAQYLNRFGFDLFKVKPLGIEIVDKPEEERTVCSYFVAIKPGDQKLINQLESYA